MDLRRCRPAGLLALVALVVACREDGTAATARVDPQMPGGGPGGATATVATYDPSLNRLLVTSKDEELVAVEPATGRHVTLMNMGEYASITSVAVTGETLLVGDRDNAVSAVDVAAKKLLWSVPLGRYENTILARPLVVTAGETAYAAGLSGVLHAIDVATHRTLWEYAVAPSPQDYYDVSAPTITADRVFVGTSEQAESNSLHAVDRATGRRVWAKPLPSHMTGRMKVAGDTLLVPAGDLLAFDVATGNMRWRVPMYDLRGAGTPSVAGDRVLVQGAADVVDGRLFCIDLATGDVLWAVDAGNDYAGIYAPTVAGDVVFGVYERGTGMLPYGNGRVFAADLATGAILWRNDDVSVESSPVFANGQLFLAGLTFKRHGDVEEGSGLVALDAANGEPRWLSSHFRYGTMIAPLVFADNGVFTFAADAP